jgi:hypothetical protein
MKRIFFHLVFLLLIYSSNAIAQTVQWAKKGISEGFENGNAIVADDSGNVYVTGQFEFLSVFDNVSIYSSGSHDIFVAKYLSDGTLKWIRRAGGHHGDVGHAIAIDDQHNVYVTGEIEDTVQFGNIQKVAAGGNDIFVAKYDANGNILWVQSAGAQLGTDKGRAIAVSPSGNVYVTGFFTYSTTFGSITLSTSGANDIFITKFDTDGQVIWAKKAGGSGQDRGYGLVLDGAENVYVTGTFTRSAVFKNTTITNPGSHSSFLAKYDKDGNLQWVNSAGACCDTTKANAVALDENGNIYVTGYFKGNTAFGTTTFSTDTLSEVFLVKYDPSGNVIWAKRAGGNEDDGSYGVCVDTSNHLVYITGSVRSSGYFDSKPYTISGFMDIFIASYDMDGNVVWLKLYGGHYRDAGAAITVDPKGYIYSTGLFNDIAQFDGVTLTGYPNQPWADFYINKISPAPSPVPTSAAASLVTVQDHCTDVRLNFTPGNGRSRLIVAHEGTAINSFPQNGVSYLASNNFGSGSDLGNNNFVVYNGSDNHATVSNLTPGATYFFSIFEYNGAGISSTYLMSSTANCNFTTTIYPINISSNSTSICSGTSIELHASGANNYSWTPSVNLSSGTDSVVMAIPETSTTFKVSGTNADGCYAEGSITVNVNSLPQVNFSTLGALCLNSAPIILAEGVPAGGIYSGPGVTNGIFYPMSAGSGIATLTYNFTDINGCSNHAQTTIQVRSIPGVVFSTTSSICENESPITLTYGSPAGGVYSGNGVNAGNFDPSSGPGAHQITYAYTNNYGCTGTASGYIVVKTAPIVNLGNDLIVCAGNAATLNAGTGYATYLWSNGATTSLINVDSSGAGIGIKQITLRVSNSSGCMNSDTIRVTFDLCAGIENQEIQSSAFELYPNPFLENLQINLRSISDIRLFDVCGRTLKSMFNATGNITIGENIPAGIYYLEITSGNNRKIIPVIKSAL